MSLGVFTKHICHKHIFLIVLGTEVVLKLRLSSTCTDVKLPVYSKDTIGQCKKKLQVSAAVMYWLSLINRFLLHSWITRVHVGSVDPYLILMSIIICYKHIICVSGYFHRRHQMTRLRQANNVSIFELFPPTNNLRNFTPSGPGRNRCIYSAMVLRG